MAEDKTKFQLEANMAKALGPNAFRANIEELKKKAEFGNRQDDTTIVNSDGANASIRLTDNKATIASSQNASMKLNGQQIVAQSYEEKHTTNRLNLEAYEVMVNGHKMNPNIWEYSDMRRFIDSQGGKYDVGCFCMLGTVLTPSWDEQLHRYVLIRRLARMPMFSPAMNVPEILNTLNIEDPTKVSFKYGYKQHTESAEEFQKKMAATLKKENEDGDAPETAPNGRHYFESDIKELMDKNEGMTREQAIEQLSKEDKYTKEWKKDTDKKDSGNGDASKESVNDNQNASSNSADGSNKKTEQLTDAQCENIYNEMIRTAPEHTSTLEENARTVASSGKTKGRSNLAKDFSMAIEMYRQQGKEKWASWAYNMSSYVLLKA